MKQTVTIGEQKVCPESESLKLSATPTPQPWFLLRKARLIFLDAIFSFKFSSTKSFRNPIAIEYLVQACASPMLNKSEKILMSMNSRQKSICQLATADLLPKETKKREKVTKARLGLMPHCKLSPD